MLSCLNVQDLVQRNLWSRQAAVSPQTSGPSSDSFNPFRLMTENLKRLNLKGQLVNIQHVLVWKLGARDHVVTHSNQSVWKNLIMCIYGEGIHHSWFKKGLLLESLKKGFQICKQIRIGKWKWKTQLRTMIIHGTIGGDKSLRIWLGRHLNQMLFYSDFNLNFGN